MNGPSNQSEPRFETVVARLRYLDLSSLSDAAEEFERRVPSDELIESVRVFSDRFQVVTSGAPRKT